MVAVKEDLQELLRLVALEETELQKLHRSISALVSQLSALRAQLSDALARAPQSLGSGSVPTAQLDKLKARYESICQAHEEVHVQTAVRQTEFDELFRSAALASSSSGELSDDQRALASAQDEWTAAVDAEQAALSQSKLALVELERRIVKQRQAIDVARREATSVKTNNAKLTRKLDEMRRRLDRVAAQQSAVAETVTERQATAAELERQLAQEEAELAMLRSDQEQLEAAAAEWQRYIEAETAGRADAAREARGGGRRGPSGGDATEQQRRALVEARGAASLLRRQNELTRRHIRELQRRADQSTNGPPPSAHGARSSTERHGMRPGGHNSPYSARSAHARADIDEEQRAAVEARLREEHALLVQREAQWREYCRATGRGDQLAGAARPERARSAGRPGLEAWPAAKLQDENDRIRQRIARLQRIAQSGGGPGVSQAASF